MFVTRRFLVLIDAAVRPVRDHGLDDLDLVAEIPVRTSLMTLSPAYVYSRSGPVTGALRIVVDLLDHPALGIATNSISALSGDTMSAASRGSKVTGLSGVPAAGPARVRPRTFASPSALVRVRLTGAAASRLPSRSPSRNKPRRRIPPPRRSPRRRFLSHLSGEHDVVDPCRFGTLRGILLFT